MTSCSWKSNPLFFTLTLLLLCTVSFFASSNSLNAAATPFAPVQEEATEASAAETTPAAGAVEPLEVTDGFTVNNLWIMIAGMLVFIMHLGFATLESGLTRSKNTVNILFKNTAIVCLGLISYAVMGFLMMYPASFLEYSGWSEAEQANYLETTEDGFLKKNGYFAFDGFGMVMNGPTQAAVGDEATAEEIAGFNAASTEEGYGNPYTLFTDFFFQAMFAATCCTIVSGAVAGRIKLGTFLIFCLFFVSLSYPITGSWKWGYGWLDRAGFYDFAGSTLVHSVGGWGALVMAFLLGPRAGKYVNGKAMAIAPSNMPMATIGVFLLWFGWFGFNGGSVLSADPGLVSLTLCTTSMAAAAGGLAAALVSTVHGKKPDLSMTLNGILAGLVGITAGADQMSLLEAIIIGLIAGVLVYVAVIFIDGVLKIDDPVGAISVHLVCGIWGTLAVGIFGAMAGTEQLLIQVKGIVAIGLFTLLFCLVLGLILKFTLGLRVSEAEEQEGLDLGEHGIHAYSL
ncbi:ammonium transporter [Mariniblastus fucicola]|uniref:Ammonia channel n=1 Tax=Mariniblastus fucicola TaxID=980251 RepID=A0A5B9P7Y7_9BACT|nr:ammonium transporter [Mariniblastus fucicola]QEG22408.1 Ammonia channel precursor [Mariniblastus fucicola]